MNFSRRDTLKTLSLGSGSVLLAPFVNRLAAENAGTFQPRRFVFVMEGNGLNPAQIQPVGIIRSENAEGQNNAGALVDRPLNSHALPAALEPLAPFASRLTVVQGLSGRICGGGHSNNFGALGCHSGKAGPYGQTIDMALAESLPAIFPQIGLGISNRPEHAVIYNTSARARGKRVPTQCRPDLAYQSLFGSVAQGNPGRAFDTDANLLDFMIDDIKRLERRLSGREKEKLTEYLDAFESMRGKQDRLAAFSEPLRKHAPKVTRQFGSEIETDRLASHFDLCAAALISGLTNVVTLASGCGEDYFNIKFTGLGIQAYKHGIGHGLGIDGLTPEQLTVRIRRFHMEQIARLAEKLENAPEGDGTMLDNTTIVYLSDAAEAHHSRCWEWPFLILGNLGGRLNTGGRYLCYPKYGNPGHRTVANLYTAFLHAAGTPRDRFGLADPILEYRDQDGPLDELLA